MGLFRSRNRKREKDLVKDPFYEEGVFLVMYVKCDNCGEVFRSHIRKTSELYPTYSGRTAYILRKELIGSKCPNRINVYAEFSGTYKTLNFEISGGHFITKEEYEKHEKEVGK